MPLHLMAVAGHGWAGRPGGTHLQSLGIFWIGFLNLLAVCTLLGASLRRRQDTGPRRRDPVDAERNEARPVTVGDRGGERASDADRDGAIEVLCASVADGRLTLDEGVERIDAALAARGRGELAELVADLPARPEPVPAAPTSPSALRLAAVAAVLAAVLVQVLGGTWLLWPVAVGVLAPLAFGWPRRARVLSVAAPATDRPSSS